MNRVDLARNVVQAGGHFVIRIETGYRHRQTRVTRLFDRYGILVRGVGEATRRELASELRQITSWKTSDWARTFVAIDAPITPEEVAISEQRERESWYYQD